MKTRSQFSASLVMSGTSLTNPFIVPDKNRLYYLTSGASVPMAIEMDVLRAEAAGMAAKSDFIGRLQRGEPKRFIDPIKKKILKTMETCNNNVNRERQSFVPIPDTYFLLIVAFLVTAITFTL